MKLCFLFFITTLLPLKCQSLPGFECPEQCECAEADRSMHLTCKWQQINSTNLNSIRNADSVLTLTIKCSHKSEQIANPEPRLFGQLRNLQRLAIDRCKMEKLPPELFYGMPTLYNLILKNADLTEIPANAFQYQSSLMSLDISGNKLQSEPQALFSLHKLMQLDLSKNSISFVSNILTSSTTLKVLSYSHNDLETLDFRRLPKSLTDLNLSNNKIAIIHAYPDTVTNLSRLDLSGNKLEFIAEKDALNELPKSLQLLDLSDNKIKEIQEGAFQKMNKLAMLDLKNNLIEEMTETAVEIGIRHRYQLYMSGNPLKCDCDNYWILHPKSKSSPIIADISNVTCSHVLDDSRKLKLLDAELMSGFLCQYDSNCLDGCECCQQRHEGKCSCYRTCPSGCRCWGSAGAHATKLGQNVVSCNNVRMDRMRYVPDGVTELHLVGSMWKDKGLAQLGRKEQLGLLNLSYSSINLLNKTLLNQFPKLSTLDLSSNKLRTIFKEDLQALSHLRVLLLHNNELEEPTKNTLELFGSLQQISLRGNHTSFECECGEKETQFQKWIRKLSNRKKIIDLHEVSCISEEHGIVRIEKMDSSQDDTICREAIPITSTDKPSRATTFKATKSMKATSSEMTTTADGVFTIDKDYMEEDDTLQAELELTTSATTVTITEAELYAIPTKPIHPTSMLTKILPTLQSLNILTTTKSILDNDFYDDNDNTENTFIGYAPNSKAIRTLAKNPTPPSNRKDYDSNNLFSVLIVFLLFVVIVLICAIISTVYYRLIRPSHYSNQKIHIPREDEEIPLNGQ